MSKNTKVWTYDEILKKVMSILNKEFPRETEGIVATGDLKYDYGIDKKNVYFDIFLVELENIFGISIEFTQFEFDNLNTVKNIVDCINARVNPVPVPEEVK
jgi:hypothetical protein